MFYKADLHTHSHYAKATSKYLTLEALYQWSQIKGIEVIGTGDFTHPAWFKELQEKLVDDGNGFFRLAHPPKEPAFQNIRTTHIEVRFCLSAEICTDYFYNGKRRRNHNLVYAPDFETVAAINEKLSGYTDLALDGRPTIKLSSRDLLEIVLQSSDTAYMAPAHAWTPWFSTLGAYGGYDSIKDCFRDLTPHIFALETGLSSDPEMNWCCSELDNLTMMSSSDAHSPQNLGRELNLFDTTLSYEAMFVAVRSGLGFLGTYEFFPEEGKYSNDGHRVCGVSFTPEQTAYHKGICPVCKKPLTIGVRNRVAQLADRKIPLKPLRAAHFEYIVPLPEILSELYNVSVHSKKIEAVFCKAISFFGNEFSLLKEASIDDITKYHPLLGKAIYNMRTGNVKRTAGYDGEYGKIKLLNDRTVLTEKQLSMF